MADLPVLTYFDGRGRAEIIRMMLCAGNIKVEITMTNAMSILLNIYVYWIVYKLKMNLCIFIFNHLPSQFKEVDLTERQEMLKLIAGETSAPIFFL